MEPRASFVEANGLRLHCLTWQPDSAGRAGFPPIVLVHATGFLARLWQPVAETLAGCGYHIHAYDTRGHGDSDKPSPRPEDYHWQNFVDDLKAFLDALMLRGVPIVGHSAGGATAAVLAATHPEYVSRLVLFEPIIRPPGEFPPAADGRARMAAGARKRRAVWPSTAEMVEAYEQRPTFARFRPDVLRLYAEEGTFRREDGEIELKCPGEIEAQIFEQSASLGAWEALPAISCPTLVMRGEHTDPMMVMISERAAGRIPGARVAVTPGAGHTGPMERPEVVAAEILRFLQ